MALSLKIEGTDRVAYLARDSLNIEQDASSYAATCSFNLVDAEGSLAISELDEVLIEEGSDVLFHGEIGSLDDEQIVANNKVARRWICRCHDDHIELENRTVEYATWEDLLYSDIEMIDDLFDAYYSTGIDYSTYVVGTPLEPAMTELTFEGISMREALSRIAERSGGAFYVHYESGGTLYFHYFDSESNVAAFHLTDTSPDYSTSFPYNEIHPEHDATALINAVYVVGKDQAKWITDATSISTYGRREAGTSNPDLLTEDAVDDFGATFIAEHKDPKLRYRVITPYGSGLRAGMQIRLVCAAKSIDSTLNINRLRIYYVEDTPYWELELGDTVPDFVSSGRALNDAMADVATQITAVHEDVFDTTAPGTPSFTSGNLSTGVAIDADGHQIVYVQATWGSVSDSDLDHYEIQVSISSDFSGFTDTRMHPSDGDRIERFTGLLGNTMYYVRVRAADWVGNQSAWSSTQSTTSSADGSAPTSPTGLTAAGARTLIGITWDANAEADLAFYEVQRAPDVGGSPGAWSTIATQKSTYFVDEDFTEAEIQASTTFHYRVRAVDTSGNNSSYTANKSAALNPIGRDTIASGAVITAKLAAGAVTAAKMTVGQLSAITADMGDITAGTVTGATVRTAASGARVQLDSTDGLQCYNSSGYLCAQIDVDGSGQIGYAEATIPPLQWNSAGEFQRIKANQIAVGGELATLDDCLLLLGQPVSIKSDSTANYWRGSRGELAQVGTANSSPGSRGALNLVQGRWANTRALIIEEATTNLITNPSLETNTTDWVFGPGTQGSGYGRITTEGRFGACCGKAVCSGTGGRSVRTTTFTRGADDDVTISVWVRSLTGTSQLILRLWETAAGASDYADSATIQVGPTWTRITLSVSDATMDAWNAGGTSLRLWIINDPDNGTAKTWLFDGAQAEAKGYATSYCDGDQGDGYSWSGTAHGSTSSRTANYIDLDDYVELINDNNTVTLVVWVQAPQDYDSETWPQTWENVIVDCRDSANPSTSYYELRFADNGNRFQFVLNNNIGALSYSYAFSEGDWLHIAITLDFSSNEYEMFINGELVDTYTSSLSVPTAQDRLRLGSLYSGGAQSGWAIAEFVLFDRVLSAEEVAQIYNHGRPLIDQGGSTRPGIIILDGEFRVQSSTTGQRVEIRPEGIGIYDDTGISGVDRLLGGVVDTSNKSLASDGDSLGWFGYDDGDDLQVAWYAAGSNAGKIVAGGGDVILDSDGISIDEGESDWNAIKWYSGTTKIAEIFGDDAPLPSDEHERLVLYVYGSSTNEDAKITMQVISDVSASAYLTLRSLDAGSPDSELKTDAEHIYLGESDSVRVYLGNSAGTYGLRRNGTHIEWYNGSSWVQLD